MKHSGLALMATVAIGLTACDSSETGPSGAAGEGKTAVFLTDAPFPFDRVARVDIHILEIGLSPQADTSEGIPDWVTVATPDRAFNLLDLQNGATALLGEAEVPPDQYRAVRVTFDPARSSMTDVDGGHPPINWQSKGETPTLFALVEEPMAIDENGEDIVIDFDVGRSFLPDDTSGGFLFIPWLRAITRTGSGSIEGDLVHAGTDDPIALAAVSVHYAFDSTGALGPLMATSRTSESGAFKASFLRPGRYTVVPEDLARGAVGPARTVEVKAGETADAGEFRF
ncbi:MAG TPA: DUF4382 domain-containing protein [Gemmatimonadales bacterium]|nr:DUF4382 domain-containing protein [Gemmatimonadales bacterium]